MGKVYEWSEVVRWERWGSSDVARSERWEGVNVILMLSGVGV